MITYDLRCDEGHLFEAWFKDRQSFLDQNRAGRVECPVCGTSRVDIAFTTCAISTERGRSLPEARNSFLQEMRRYLEENFDDVGDAFAEEARRIHRGETRKRGIRGVTSKEEEGELREEGIDFVKIPLPKLDA